MSAQFVTVLQIMRTSKFFMNSVYGRSILSNIGLIVAPKAINSPANVYRIYYPKGLSQADDAAAH